MLPSTTLVVVEERLTAFLLLSVATTLIVAVSWRTALATHIEFLGLYWLAVYLLLAAFFIEIQPRWLAEDFHSYEARQNLHHDSFVNKERRALRRRRRQTRLTALRGA